MIVFARPVSVFLLHIETFKVLLCEESRVLESVLRPASDNKQVASFWVSVTSLLHRGFKARLWSLMRSVHQNHVRLENICSHSGSDLTLEILIQQRTHEC